VLPHSWQKKRLELWVLMGMNNRKRNHCTEGPQTMSWEDVGEPDPNPMPMSTETYAPDGYQGHMSIPMTPPARRRILVSPKVPLLNPVRVLRTAVMKDR